MAAKLRKSQLKDLEAVGGHLGIAKALLEVIISGLSEKQAEEFEDKLQEIYDAIERAEDECAEVRPSEYI